METIHRKSKGNIFFHYNHFDELNWANIEKKKIYIYITQSALVMPISLLSAQTVYKALSYYNQNEPNHANGVETCFRVCNNVYLLK